jgi:hypothetical protein
MQQQVPALVNHYHQGTVQELFLGSPDIVFPDRELLLALTLLNSIVYSMIASIVCCP